PIQMVTMLSSIGNKGVYVKPHLIKEIISNTEKDEDGERKTTVIEKEEGDRVISEETAKNILSMMQSVVDEGTGKKAKVEGIGIGGKTGTSEDGVNTNKYIASFIGIGPTENPQIVILVTLYNPKGEGGHTGGGVAAPLAGNILNEIFQYLN
ncbi:penicillin-binding transpeptidase domain-containing protein, partial [Ralstonia pseudosolanacearum]|uniref:penicillin-binding transpeptidase domain-containing protein n=1 Tax=Ralstonia pseudosolanacearum TaxID=1310165 RepID=UPI003CEE7B40